ncbi:helix-turn-helix domain-containing protein [Atopobiaceae bacterium 24-176]
MLDKDSLPDCPVATTLGLIGSKWKIFIIQRLLDRPYRFNELGRSIDGLSDKVLTDNLKQLEADGVISRTVYPETPVRVVYRLSDIGESMRPIISAMHEWGLRYQEKTR